MEGFLNAQVPYQDMKADTAKFLDQVRADVKARPSMDVPFHAVLVQRLATFLTRTQSNFPPAFYSWMKLLANLYFILVMLAAPGIIGLCVQLLVIFVFYGLLMIIEDMDFAIDTNATLYQRQNFEGLIKPDGLRATSSSAKFTFPNPAVRRDPDSLPCDVGSARKPSPKGWQRKPTRRR